MVVRGCRKVQGVLVRRQGTLVVEGGDNTLLAAQSRKGLSAAAGRTTFPPWAPSSAKPTRLIWKSQTGTEAHTNIRTFHEAKKD